MRTGLRENRIDRRRLSCHHGPVGRPASGGSGRARAPSGGLRRSPIRRVRGVLPRVLCLWVRQEHAYLSRYDPAPGILSSPPGGCSCTGATSATLWPHYFVGDLHSSTAHWPIRAPAPRKPRSIPFGSPIRRHPRTFRTQRIEDPSSASGWPSPSAPVDNLPWLRCQ